MREIKFRGKHKKLGWVYGDLQHFMDEDVCIFLKYEEISYVIDEKTVGQFTGLHNGKEIYQGDVICFDNSAIGGKKVIGEVIFNEDNTLGYLGWALWNNGFIPCDFLGSIKILGNIHENPDILKGEK